LIAASESTARVNGVASALNIKRIPTIIAAATPKANFSLVIAASVV
jgi:hypothetical protein